MASVTQRDRDILRDLARQYMDVCCADRNKAAVRLWRDHNSLIKTRPPVVCMVAFASHIEHEIDAALPELETSPEVQWIERWFRRTLWGATIPDDTVYLPWFPTQADMQKPDGGMAGIRIDHVFDEVSKSYRRKPEHVIETLADLKWLKTNPHVVLDDNPPHARLARDLFGDILPVHVNRSTSYPIWSGTDLSETVGSLVGIEQLLYMLYDSPDVMHALMAFLRDAVLENIEQGEAAGDWSTTEHQNYSLPPHCHELPDPEANAYGAKLSDLWFFTHAQEFETVGPEQHEEFLLNYQMPIMEKFGLVNYGCCETLDRKIDMLRKIKNLRRICIGPMASVKRSAEAVGQDYILSWRPNPAIMVSNGFDPERVRATIRQAIADSQGSHMEIMLKELMTVEGDLSRLFKWTEIAMQESRNA